MLSICFVKSLAKMSNERLIGDDIVALSLFSTPFLYFLVFYSVTRIIDTKRKRKKNNFLARLSLEIEINWG